MNRFVHRWWPALIACLAAPPLMAQHTGLVSKYKVNGEVVISGLPADDLRAIAGEPLSIDTPRGRDFERHWEYRCDRPGLGPCRTVQPPGKRVMVVVLVRDRVERIVYSPVSDDGD